jgi:hypothetical protein
MSSIPFDIREAVVQACGKAFWLKDPFRGFLLSAGVPSHVYDRYAEESKYKIARHVLSDLDDRGEDGWAVQRRVVTELCKLRDVPDPTVPDRDAALKALRSLKELAVTRKVLVEDERSVADQRMVEARRRQAALAARARKTQELRAAYNQMAVERDDPQKRGYGLEDLLAELFEVHEIIYRRPYRTATEQIDGHFEFKGFNYLVEARWRVIQPGEADLAAFKGKVDKKLSSTRGVFFSIVGFRKEVVMEFTRGISSNIVLFDGADLSLILEGHLSLIDALDLKIQKASQEGIIYFPLVQRFGPSAG